jgi:hypothetical protein
MHIPVHPGRGLGHDDGFDGVDVAPAGLVRRTPDPREFPARSAGTRTRAPIRQLGSLKKTEPKCKPEAEIAANAWAQLASTAGPHDRHFRVGCAHATLRFLLYPGNGITVFTKGEAMPDAH